MNYADFTTRYTRYTKTAKSVSEAFKDADYATAITKPKQSDFEGFGAFLGGMLFLVVFAYSFWLTIGRYSS